MARIFDIMPLVGCNPALRGAVLSVQKCLQAWTQGVLLAGAICGMGTIGVTKAQADITITGQHNALDAYAQWDYLDYHRHRVTQDTPLTSDALTSFGAAVKAAAGSASAHASIVTTLKPASISISSVITCFTAATRIYGGLAVDTYAARGSTSTALQFHVSQTGYYNISASSVNPTGSVKLLGGGVVVFQTSTTFTGRTLLSVGTVYEVDAAASIPIYFGGGTRGAGYAVTMIPAN